MSRRTERVGELLRRELATILVSGEVHDPRLAHSAAVSITEVRVSGNLSVARVFVDVLAENANIDAVLAALRANTGRFRHMLGQRTDLRRAPELRFEHDVSIERGAQMGVLLESLVAPGTEPDATADDDRTDEQ